MKHHVAWVRPKAIPADRFPVVPKLKILSSNSSALGSTFYPLDPLSDIGRTVFELDAIRLATGQKCDRTLVDECHVPQIQNYLLPGCFQGEQFSQFLDILRFDSATEREHDSAIG